MRPETLHFPGNPYGIWGFVNGTRIAFHPGASVGGTMPRNALSKTEYPMEVTTMRGIIPVALLAALPLALSADAASAQDAQDAEIQQCVAELTPAAIDASGVVQHVNARLSEDIGEITGIEAPAESGLAIATPDEVEMAEMSTEEAAEEEMADMATEGFSAALWLSAKDATPGTYQIVLQGENGTCATEVTVEEGEEQS